MDHILQRLCGELALIDDEYATQTESTSEDDTRGQPKELTGGDKSKGKTREIVAPYSLKASRPGSQSATLNVDTWLVRLPAELQLMILQYLTFGQIESLRRTCRIIRSRINKPFIRELFPSMKVELLSTCYRCLSYDPLRENLVRANESDARYPLANECLSCVSSRGGFIVGRTYTLGTWATVCICRYCGFPVTSDAAWKEYDFHRSCYRRYRVILLYYMLVGCAQGTITIIGAALCWSFFKGDKMVIAPTIVNFIVACWAFCLNMARGIELRTYHWSLLLESCILGLWIPPLIAIVETMQQRSEGPRHADKATVFFVACNLLFRFLNVLGNIFLVCEYKIWHRYKPNQSRPRRILNKVITFLVFWTYPPSIEQKYPGRWWFVKRPARTLET